MLKAVHDFGGRLLRGSGLVLLHEDALWSALDAWLRDLSAETFVELLPLLRRAFAGFQPPELGRDLGSG